MRWSYALYYFFFGFSRNFIVLRKYHKKWLLDRLHGVRWLNLIKHKSSVLLKILTFSKPIRKSTVYVYIYIYVYLWRLSRSYHFICLFFYGKDKANERLCHLMISDHRRPRHRNTRGPTGALPAFTILIHLIYLIIFNIFSIICH